MVLDEMKLPVGIEVSRRSERSEAQDSFGSREGPASPGAVHAVLHEVPARALDDTGRDGESVAECLGVVHQARPRPICEVVARDLDGLSARVVEILRASLPPSNRLSDVSAALAREEGEEAVADPALGLRIGLSPWSHVQWRRTNGVRLPIPGNMSPRRPLVFSV